MRLRRVHLVTAGLILLISVLMIIGMDDPAYADAYYYYNAAQRLADGDGLTDAVLWNYINAPDDLPTESHRYWMPLTSLVAAVPMFILGTDFSAAQLVYIPLWIAYVWLAMHLAQTLSDKRRHQWITGLAVIFGGFYFPFWLTTDTFLLFGLVGCGALLAMGYARQKPDVRWFALVGVLSGVAHLARADGMLFLLVGLMVIWWRGRQVSMRDKITEMALMLGCYLVVTLPWFIRNQAVLGAPLPAGGINTAFLRGYNDLFSYQADWSWQYFWAWDEALQSRVDALLTAFQTWLAVEGMILLAPLALAALIKRRRDGFLMGMIWYAIGLHLAMSLVFAYPGARGGLFHSSAALFPFWVVLGLIGLDDLVAWIGKKRRWNIQGAQLVFGISILLLPIFLSLTAWSRQQQATPPDYDRYIQGIPADARLMVNNPAAWYYHTGRISVTLPDDPLPTVQEIAERYCLTHMILDRNVTRDLKPLIEGTASPPAFLIEIGHLDDGTADWEDDVRIYQFEVDCE